MGLCAVEGRPRNRGDGTTTRQAPSECREHVKRRQAQLEGKYPDRPAHAE